MRPNQNWAGRFSSGSEKSSKQLYSLLSVCQLVYDHCQHECVLIDVFVPRVLAQPEGERGKHNRQLVSMRNTEQTADKLLLLLLSSRRNGNRDTTLVDIGSRRRLTVSPPAISIANA